jgi:FtsP/CotA-like multicopper oxidase with cupredoxin domain
VDAGLIAMSRIVIPCVAVAWYQSHSRFQEQTGHYGALIIHPKGKDPIEYDREYVILLSDWTDEDPEVLFANLKQESTSPVSTLRWLP